MLRRLFLLSFVLCLTSGQRTSTTAPVATTRPSATPAASPTEAPTIVPVPIPAPAPVVDTPEASDSSDDKKNGLKSTTGDSTTSSPTMIMVGAIGLAVGIVAVVGMFVFTPKKPMRHSEIPTPRTMGQIGYYHEKEQRVNATPKYIASSFESTPPLSHKSQYVDSPEVPIVTKQLQYPVSMTPRTPPLSTPMTPKLETAPAVSHAQMNRNESDNSSFFSKASEEVIAAQSPRRSCDVDSLILSPSELQHISRHTSNSSTNSNHTGYSFTNASMGSVPKDIDENRVSYFDYDENSSEMTTTRPRRASSLDSIVERKLSDASSRPMRSLALEISRHSTISSYNPRESMMSSIGPSISEVGDNPRLSTTVEHHRALPKQKSSAFDDDTSYVTLNIHDQVHEPEPEPEPKHKWGFSKFFGNREPKRESSVCSSVESATDDLDAYRAYPAHYNEFTL